MLSFRSIGRMVNDRRNWPVIVIAGAITFIGAQVFDALGMGSAVWIILLIAIIALVARPFIKSSTVD